MTTEFRPFARTMKLRAGRGQVALTAEEFKRIPKLYAQDGLGDEAIVHVKYFDPTGSYTWYLTELDPEEGIAFAYTVSSHCPEGELGYVSIPELAEIVVRFGLGVERDIHWKPTRLGDVMAKYRRRESREMTPEEVAFES